MIKGVERGQQRACEMYIRTYVCTDICMYVCTCGTVCRQCTWNIPTEPAFGSILMCAASIDSIPVHSNSMLETLWLTTCTGHTYTWQLHTMYIQYNTYICSYIQYIRTYIRTYVQYIHMYVHTYVCTLHPVYVHT